MQLVQVQLPERADALVRIVVLEATAKIGLGVDRPSREPVVHDSPNSFPVRSRHAVEKVEQAL